MKSKIFIIVIIIIVFGVGGFLAYQKKIWPVQSGPAPAQNQAQNQTQNSTSSQTQQNPQQSQGTIETNDFFIALPAGWQKITPSMGATAMAVKVNEQLSDPVAQKANFNSYFAVSYDQLQGRTLAQYVQDTKTQLQQAIPGTTYTDEQGLTINGNPANSLVADFTQQGIDFKVLLVIIQGKGEDVWVISFNTVKSSWNDYRETFYDTANSFVVK